MIPASSAQISSNPSPTKVTIAGCDATTTVQEQRELIMHDTQQEMNEVWTQEQGGVLDGLISEFKF